MNFGEICLLICLVIIHFCVVSYNLRIGICLSIKKKVADYDFVLANIVNIMNGVG